MDGNLCAADGAVTLAGVQDYLTLDQAADAIGISRDDAYQLVRAGTLPGTWIPEQSMWYVRREDLDTHRQA